MNRLALAFLTVTSVIFDCYCSNEEMLQIDLMSNYNTNVTPKNDTAAVDVSVFMTLLSIVEFNEIKETIVTNAAFELQWTDVNLIWDPSAYGNVTETIFKAKQIWLPSMFASNAINMFGGLGDDDLLVLVTYDGKVEWTTITTVETICKVNTEYFPYDKQSCAVKLITRAQTRNMIHVILPLPYIRMYSFTQNGQWVVTSTSSDLLSAGNFQIVYFGLHLTRRHEYYVTSLIMPTLFVSVLNCFVLMLPNSSGEKVSFSITVFLSYMVLLTFTADYLPRTSEYEPYIVNYIGSMLGLSFASVVCSVISLLIQSALTKSTSDRPDDAIDDVSSKDTDTPIISSVNSTEPSKDTHSANMKSKILEIKTKSAWGEQEQGNSDSGEYRFGSKRCSWITKQQQQQLGQLKSFIKKCLSYFDIFASSCIILTTGYVTVTTMITLTNQN